MCRGHIHKRYEDEDCLLWRVSGGVRKRGRRAAACVREIIRRGGGWRGIAGGVRGDTLLFGGALVLVVAVADLAVSEWCEVGDGKRGDVECAYELSFCLCRRRERERERAQRRRWWLFWTALLYAEWTLDAVASPNPNPTLAPTCTRPRRKLAHWKCEPRSLCA